MTKQKFLLIDVINKKVEEIEAGELQEFYTALNCDYIESIPLQIGGKLFYAVADEEGALKKNQIPSVCDARGKTLLVGNIMLTNYGDNDGEFLSIKDEDIAFLKRWIRISPVTGAPILIVYEQ